MARLLSEPIFSDDLEPPRDLAEQQKQHLTERGYETWLFESRTGRLSSRILSGLIERYAREHHLEGGEEEVLQAKQALRGIESEDQRALEERMSSLLEESADPKTTPQRREALSRQMATVERLLANAWEPSSSRDDSQQQEDSLDDAARQMVRAWLVNRHLYERYGGTVIWQQAGLEPVGAYRRWLRELEERGDFAIYDADLSKHFWDYFLRDHPFVMDDEAIRHYCRETGLAHPFERPWWLLSSPTRPR